MKLMRIHHKNVRTQLHLIADDEVDAFFYHVRSELGCVVDETPQIEFIKEFATLKDCVEYTYKEFPDEGITCSLPAPPPYDYQPTIPIASNIDWLDWAYGKYK
jgi:hypothetical protein